MNVVAEKGLLGTVLNKFRLPVLFFNSTIRFICSTSNCLEVDENSYLALRKVDRARANMSK